jgi:hypothetical protein
MTGVLPKQKISNAARNLEWYKENAKYRIDQTKYWSSDRWEMVSLFKAASGELDVKDYKYVLNPYNSEDENATNYPAMLRNVDIISPILSSLLGEKANKPFNHQCIVANPDANNQAKEELNKRYTAYLAQRFVNNLNESGYNTGVPSQPVPPSFQQTLQNDTSSDDKRAIFGQEALEYLKYNLDLKDKYQEAYYDWLVTGRTFTYKDVYKDDVIHEIVPVLEMWYGTTHSGFIEDSDWAVRRTRFNMSQIIDRFHKVLNDTEIGDLENKFKGGEGNVSIDFGGGIPNIDKNTISTISNIASSDLIDVFHIVWKGYEKVGILTYINQLTGTQEEVEVNDEYVLNEKAGDIKVDWEYNSCVYEVFQIGDGPDALYKYFRPILVQRNALSNSSDVKLPYNGRIGYNDRTTVNSVVKQLVPYQALYNIFHFRREMTLARNKDKLSVFPIGLIPDEFGAEIDGLVKFLHFAENTGFLFFDESKEEALAVLQAIKSIDLGLGNYVHQMSDLLASLKQEAWDAIGMNRQRYGDVNSSDGKGVNEQAIFRSAVITREMNRRFEKFEEKDLQGLLEYSKVAWINGKKGMYINSDGRRAFLEVNPDEHADTEYGVFAIDSADEEQKLLKGKEYAFGWAQKSTVSAGIVLDILDSNNMAHLKAKVKTAEKIQQQYEASREDANMQNQQAIQDKKDKDAALERDKDITVAEIQAGSTIHAKMLDLKAKGEGDQSIPVDDTYNQIIENIRKSTAKNYKEGQKVYDKLSSDRYKEADLALKEKALDQQKEIANKRTKGK